MCGAHTCTRAADVPLFLDMAVLVPLGEITTEATGIIKRDIWDLRFVLLNEFIAGQRRRLRLKVHVEIRRT